MVRTGHRSIVSLQAYVSRCFNSFFTDSNYALSGCLCGKMPQASFASEAIMQVRAECKLDPNIKYKVAQLALPMCAKSPVSLFPHWLQPRVLLPNMLDLFQVNLLIQVRVLLGCVLDAEKRESDPCAALSISECLIRMCWDVCARFRFWLSFLPPFRRSIWTPLASQNVRANFASCTRPKRNWEHFAHRWSLT